MQVASRRLITKVDIVNAHIVTNAILNKTFWQYSFILICIKSFIRKSLTP